MIDADLLGSIILWGGRIIAITGALYLICVAIAAVYLAPVLPREGEDHE